ncbi:hypothetical protein [Bacillus solimangrovi]|uniref:Uncharacterized protein n=1 Tax=Bacillus solimangrovi TaxID=1305675 RepID=A0A1E5LEK1_9BACI|nr:hypothetical protein [Bacillus solimangrovi]OEH92494.1 hypothetical protein BFG57_15670 [Bacillus solimangrovi]
MAKKKIFDRIKVSQIIASLISILIGIWVINWGLEANHPFSLYFRNFVGIIFFVLSLLVLIKKQPTKEQQLEKWKSTRKRGVYYYIFTRGILGWGLPLGIMSWGLDVDFSQGFRLSELIIRLTAYIVGGLIIGGLRWSQMELELEEVQIEQS